MLQKEYRRFRTWFGASVRFSGYPHVLWLVICVGSSPLSSLIYTSSGVGLPAILPCTYTSDLKTSSPPQDPYIQWQTVIEIVLERTGSEQFQGVGYKGRADVPQVMLEEGNCSLLLQDIRFSDAGLYESYLVVGQTNVKTRIFIQSVQLTVFDHKSRKSVEKGKDLVLDLHTTQAVKVVFQGAQDPKWKILWERNSVLVKRSRLEEGEGVVILRRVRTVEAGTYRVLDPQGLALSTVQVTVEEAVPDERRQPTLQEKQVTIGEAKMNSPSSLLIIITLLSFCHLML